MNPDFTPRSGASPEEDAALLIRQMADGDSGALERFYKRYSSLAWSLALRILQNTADAQEVLQDAFLQVWNKSGGYNPSRGNPEAWLTTIVRSRAIDRLRSRRRRNRDTESLDALENWESLFPAGEESGRTALSPAMESALKQLPEEHRKILDLVYFEGYTQTEIAGKLSIPLGTAKTRIRASLKRLREIIGGMKETI